MRKHIFCAACLLVVPLAPLTAQGLDLTIRKDPPQARTSDPADRVTPEEALQRNQAVYGPQPPRRDCRELNAESGEEEIVVCAEEERDQSQFRVQSTAELDPTGRDGTRDGLPRAPDVAGDGIFKGKGILTFGSVPPPAIMFDITELPEAPEGSDADKISKGQKRAD